MAAKFRFNTSGLSANIRQILNDRPAAARRAMNAVGGYLNGEAKDLCAVLPFVLNEYLPDPSGVNPSMIRAFVEGAFPGQDTLNIRIRDLIGDGVENKYPILALPKFQNVLDLSFDIDKESISPYLDKLCPAKPSKSKPKPSADVDKEDIDSSRE